MTFQHRPPCYRPLGSCLPDSRLRWSRLSWPALAVGFLLLAGCDANRPVAGSSTRVFAADFAGAARSCIVPKPTIKDGEAADVAVRLGNDGGWCGITLDRSGTKPFDAGLLTRRPTHGKVFIHSVGDATRIDYTPDRGFIGADNFAVKLIPGDATVNAQVTVAQVAGAQVTGAQVAGKP